MTDKAEEIREKILDEELLEKYFFPFAFCDNCKFSANNCKCEIGLPIMQPAQFENAISLIIEEVKFQTRKETSKNIREEIEKFKINCTCIFTPHSKENKHCPQNHIIPIENYKERLVEILEKYEGEEK